MKTYRFKIFVINPGSTSTKLALFEDNRKVLETSVSHDASVLNSFKTNNDQLEYRMNVIRKFISDNDIDLSDVDAFVGRGGGCYPVPSGTYEVNDRLLDDIRNNVGCTMHPSVLGVQLAHIMQSEYGGRLFMVDPICVDEYTDVARITGVKGIERKTESHALNLRGTAMKHCKIHGLDYHKTRLVVAHIDGGITIAAHDCGKQVDCNEGAGGEGPFTATRTGSLPLMGVLDYLETHSIDEMRHLCSGTGGFVSHFGTSDADEVYEMVKNGDEKARLLWDAMGYNIVKYIGSMAVVLKGQVDGILITGRYTRFETLIEGIREYVGWIAPIYIYENEVEQEAMAAGALRVLRGKEKPKIYTGRAAIQGYLYD
ncbi:MAG: butyrate kinase [Mogibacterium sp.]|nr:butyrate kinase [Mogibacterium sp.]